MLNKSLIKLRFRFLQNLTNTLFVLLLQFSCRSLCICIHESKWKNCLKICWERSLHSLDAINADQAFKFPQYPTVLMLLGTMPSFRCWSLPHSLHPRWVSVAEFRRVTNCFKLLLLTTDFFEVANLTIPYNYTLSKHERQKFREQNLFQYH